MEANKNDTFHCIWDSQADRPHCIFVDLNTLERELGVLSSHPAVDL